MENLKLIFESAKVCMLAIVAMLLFALWNEMHKTHEAFNRGADEIHQTNEKIDKGTNEIIDIKQKIGL